MLWAKLQCMSPTLPQVFSFFVQVYMRNFPGKSNTAILLHVSKQAPEATRAKRATTRGWRGRVDSSAGFPCADPAPALSTFSSGLGFNSLEALRKLRT